MVPRGHALPPEVWHARHRWVTTILAFSAAALPVFGMLRGFPLTHSVLEAVGPALMVALACTPGLGRRVRSSVSAVGLMLVASLVVHLSGGSIEAHFLYFVMVPIVALYEAWLPFGLAVGYVLFQHGVIGTLHASVVYDHPSARDKPWLWAGIHAALFAVSCLASMVNWRLHEQARAAAVDLERARATLAQQASTDPLTGLRNRLGLEADLVQMQALSERYDHSFCVALCDIDLFKSYNDTYGHLAGDQALRAIAGALTEQLRKSDRIYRFGGEEFLVLLPEQDEDQAADALQRVQSRLGSLAIPHRGAGPGAVLTLSAGLACSRPGRRLSDRQLVAAADRALYEAKDAGRNRTRKATS